MKKFRLAAVLTLTIAIVMALGSSVFAFDDIPGGKAKDKILSLKERGIVQGNGKFFAAGKKLTYAEGVHMIVKGLDLNLAAFLFIKEPLASDSFDKVPNNAWYSQSFVIAAVHGLDLPRDIDPKAHMTREAFAHYLFSAMMMKGDFSFTKKFYVITDDADIDADYKQDIQLLLNAHIAELDKDGNFFPKKAITRLEAAIMLYNTIEFIKGQTQPNPEENVTYTTEPVNAEVNKVTLYWGEQPNPGYRISISQIVFTDEKTAEVHYQLHYPEKDKSYAQVITKPTADTFVSSRYEIVLKRDL